MKFVDINQIILNVCTARKKLITIRSYTRLRYEAIATVRAIQTNEYNQVKEQSKICTQSI